MFFHRPDPGVFLIQQVAFRCLHLLPHIGDTEHQIFKGDRAVLVGGQGTFGTVRAGEGEHGTAERRIVCTVHLENGQLALPNVVVEGQVMTGVVLFDGLAVLGDCNLINRFVPIIARPAGALLDAVGAIGQVLRSAFSIFSNGDDVPLRFLGLVVTSSRFQINGECKTSPRRRWYGRRFRWCRSNDRSCATRPLRSGGTSSGRTDRRRRLRRWTCPWCRRHQGA